MLETAQYECPYCGEVVETSVDLSGEINAVNEFEDLALVGNDAPTAISLLD